MDHATPPANRQPGSRRGLHRLILAGSAAGALVTLCWAALQVRSARAELRELRRQIASASAPAPLTTTALAAAPDPATAVAFPVNILASQVSAKVTPGPDAATESAGSAEPADSAGARVGELEEVITFLRKENAAAQQTIERLSRSQSGAAGDAASPARRNGGPRTAGNE